MSQFGNIWDIMGFQPIRQSLIYTGFINIFCTY